MTSNATRLTLGQFVFNDMAIPEGIGFGGDQQISVKRFVGGGRDVQTLGFDPEAPSWSGVFLGQDAMSNATTLKAMTATGNQYLLTWDALSYLVVIRSFRPVFQKAFHIPYSIVCEVIADNSQPVQYQAPSVNTAIMQDAGAASALSTQIAALPNAPSASGLASAMSALTAAIAAVSDFSKASQSTINSVLAPLAQAQKQVNLLIASAENTLGSVSTVGGLLPNNPIAKSVAQLSNYAAAAQSSPMLVQLSGVLGRIGSNLGQSNSSIRVVTVSGGNLFDLASKEYGNAMGWTVIAAANPSLKGETQITGVTSLVIPPYTNRTDGITQ